MDLKKFRKSVTALTLGTLLITNLGLPVFVKASGNDEKLPEMNEKVENLTTVTVSGENNTGSGEITEVAEIEEEKDSITTENTEESEIIEIEEVIEDDDNSGEEISIGSRPIQPGSSKLDNFHQGVVSGYLDAATLIKMKQVNKKTADGTECSGFITNYIENFYNKFTETKTRAELTPDYAGNCLFSLNPGDKSGYLCDSCESTLALQQLFSTQVRVVPLTQDFMNDEKVTAGLKLDFNRIVIKNFYTLYLLLPRYYKVSDAGPAEYQQISEDLFKLEMRLLNKNYIRSLPERSKLVPKTHNYARFLKKNNRRICFRTPGSPNATLEMTAKLRAYNALKKEHLLHRHSALRILPGNSNAEKEKYFEKSILPIVGIEQNYPKPGLPEELLAQIRETTHMPEEEFNNIYQMVRDEIPGPGESHQRFDYKKIHQMPRWGYDNPRGQIGSVCCFENPNKKSTITLDGKEVQLTYDELRSMQLFQELPVWRVFGLNTQTADIYLEADLGRDARNLPGIWALSLVKPKRFKQILIDLSKYGTMESADIENLHSILRAIADNQGYRLRYQSQPDLNEETLQNVITLLRFLKTPYEYNELFLSRAIVQLLLQLEYWMGSTKEPEKRVLKLFLQNDLVRNESETVKKLIKAIRKRPTPAEWSFEKEYKEYKSYLNSVFPDAFTETLRF